MSSATHPIIPRLVELGPERSNLRYSRGPRCAPLGPAGLPLFKPPYGRITAIDFNEGEIVWQESNGLGPASIRDHPRLPGRELPTLGGGRDLLLVTETLLFSGQQRPDAEGSYLLTACETATGEVLAEVPFPERAIGAPMSYRVEGTQYIALTVQGNPPRLVA